MDHTRDNPLKRFTAFWVALLLITAFGIACLIFGLLKSEKGNAAYEVAANDRKAIRADVDRAQASALDQAALDRAIESTAASLLSSKPVPTQPAAPAPAAQPEPASE